MPKKANTQLNEVVSMIKDAVSRGPLTTERKKAIMQDIQEKFKCSDKTAYYYYFYKAQKQLKAEGFEVMAAKPKAVKKSKVVKTTSEMISDLPKPMADAMRSGNPFAQLMTA